MQVPEKCLDIWTFDGFFPENGENKMSIISSEMHQRLLDADLYKIGLGVISCIHEG